MQKKIKEENEFKLSQLKVFFCFTVEIIKKTWIKITWGWKEIIRSHSSVLDWEEKLR